MPEPSPFANEIFVAVITAVAAISSIVGGVLGVLAFLRSDRDVPRRRRPRT